MTLFKSIIIFILLFIVIGGTANFYYPQRISGVLSALTGQISSLNANETKCPEAVPVFCTTPASEQNSSSLLEIAANACRVFGTFKIGNFANLEQLMPEFSEDFKAKMTAWIASQKNAALNNDFDTIITTPSEGKTVFSDEKNGQIIILTDRTKIKDNTKKESANENCLVNFRKNNAKWEIENIIFSKIE